MNILKHNQFDLLYKKWYNKLMSIPKIKKASNFRAELFETLKDVSNGEKHIVTHNSGGPVVLISQKDYNEVLNKIELLKEVSIGAHQVENENWVSHEDALVQIEKLKNKWK